MRWSRRGIEVVAVYAQPPRPAGRGKAERKTAVHERAEELGIEVRTPRTLRDPEEQGRFRALDADLARGRRLRADPAEADPRSAEGRLHQRPRLAPPPLARRGADPARDPRRRRGQRRHASCRWTKGSTPGRCCSSASSTFAARMRAKSRKKWRNSARRRWSSGSTHPTPPEPQPSEGATYASKIDKAEARIDWTRACRADRAAGPRLQSRARRLVRGERRADQAARGGCRRRCFGRARRSARRLPDHRLRRRANPPADGPARRARRR